MPSPARNTLLIAQREYAANVRTKAFWIGVLMFPIILVLVSVVPAILGKAKDARRFAIIDQSGWLAAAVEERAAFEDAKRLVNALRADGTKPELEAVRAVFGPAASTVAALTPPQIAEAARALAVEGKSQLGSEPWPGALDGSTRATFEGRRAAFLSYWRSLSSKDARAIDSSLGPAKRLRVEAPAGGDAESTLRKQLDDDSGLFAFFVIGADPLAPGASQNKYVSNNLTDEALREWFSRHATAEVQARRFAAEKITSDIAARIQAPFAFETKLVGEGGTEKQVEAKDVVRQWAPVVFVYLLWISVYSIATSLMMSTIEEKSSRIMEVLLSSVSPMELLAGKIVGMAAVGLTMTGAWVVFFFAMFKALPRLVGGNLPFDPAMLVHDPIFLVSFVFYFLLGYLLYASILVGIGSVCNSMQEAQNLMGPLMLVLFIPLMTMVPVGQDPNGLLAKVLSFVPILTPFVMMNRAAGPPALWEYAATSLLLVASLAGMLWMSAKVFRVGILMTGKPPKLGEIFRWIRQPVGVAIARRENGDQAS